MGHHGHPGRAAAPLAGAVAMAAVEAEMAEAMVGAAAAANKRFKSVELRWNFGF